MKIAVIGTGAPDAAGATDDITTIESPGHLVHGGGPASLAFAEWDNNSSARVENLRTAITESGAVAPRRRTSGPP